MIKYNNEIKANGVNGAATTSSGSSVAPGQSHFDQEGTVRHRATGPGFGGDQANPAQKVTGPHGETPKTFVQRNNESKRQDTTKNQRERRKERKIRQILSLHDIFEKDEPYYPKMVNLTFPGIDISSDLNIIRAEAELNKQIGKPERIIKANKSTLLVETKTKDQTEKLLEVKNLAGKQTEAKIHPTLNTVKGVIKSRSFGACTEEEIVNHLKDQGVASCYRHKIHRNGELIKTDTYFLNFKLMKLPKTLKITDWHHELVEEYRERPRQCTHCYRYSHLAKFCRHESPTCARCGQQGHRAGICPNDLCCLHCKKEHYANDRECEKYKIECEILSTQIKEKTSRIDAMQKVSSQRPDGGRLYSSITRTNNDITINSNNLNNNNNEEPNSNLIIPSQESSSQPTLKETETQIQQSEALKKQAERTVEDSPGRRNKRMKHEETREAVDKLIKEKKNAPNPQKGMYNKTEKTESLQLETKKDTNITPLGSSEAFPTPMETNLNDRKRPKPDDSDGTSPAPKPKQANRGYNHKNTTKEDKNITEKDKSKSLQSLSQYDSDESGPSTSKNKDNPPRKHNNKLKERDSSKPKPKNDTNKITVINSQTAHFKYK